MGRGRGKERRRGERERGRVGNEVDGVVMGLGQMLRMMNMMTTYCMAVDLVRKMGSDVLDMIPLRCTSTGT